MHQSPIWVVDEDSDHRSHNIKAYPGREVLRQRQHSERRQKIAQARLKRGVGQSSHARGAMNGTSNIPDPEDSSSSHTKDAMPSETARIVGASLVDMLEKEDPDYIDDEENAALEAALATRSVDAVIGFSTTLATPMSHRATRAAPASAEEGRAAVSGGASGDDLEEEHEGDTSADQEEKRWSGQDATADTDDVDTQNEHWRKVQVRTPVDVPLDLLPATQRLETLQVQEDMKIFSDETNKGALPPKRYLRSAWWLPRSKWRVLDPEQPATLQNPHRPRDFSAEGHTYLPMGQELLRSGVSYDKLDEDDRRIAENENTIEHSTVGKRYKEFLIAEGFQDRKHLPHYLDSCKVSGDVDGSWRTVQHTVKAATMLYDQAKTKSTRDKARSTRSPSSSVHPSSNTPRRASRGSPRASPRLTPRLPEIRTPRN